MSCCGRLDDVCDKQVARYEEEQGRSENEVLLSIIMASNAYENAVLLNVSSIQLEVREFAHLSEVLDHQSQVPHH